MREGQGTRGIKGLVLVQTSANKVSPPPPPCKSYALVQATAVIGTVLIWYLI